MCLIWDAVYYFFEAYILVMFLYAIVSWVPSLRGRWSDYVAMLVEPVLLPVRRVIPPLGGLDLSFLVVVIVLQIVVNTIVNPQRVSACFF
jgi:YggT family protein